MQNVRTKGHNAERAFVRWLKVNGFPEACTTRAVMGRDGFAQFSDIAGVQGFNLEVKNRKEVNVGASLVQATDGVHVPTAVIKPYGVTDVGKWWAIHYVGDAAPLWARAPCACVWPHEGRQT
jgi:hypothetical protein